jgi:hypothetical protein
MSGLRGLIQKKVAEIIEDISEVPKEEIEACLKMFGLPSAEDEARCERLSSEFGCSREVALVAVMLNFEYFDEYERRIPRPPNLRN